MISLCLNDDDYVSDISNLSVVDTCAIVYDKDADFGRIGVVDVPIDVPRYQANSPPSSRISRGELSHLSPQQQVELLHLLDRYKECFSETPG